LRILSNLLNFGKASQLETASKFKIRYPTMQELIPINVLIGDRTYRVKIDPNDEEPVRKTLKIINDKILEFKTQFSGKDMQDYIAMVLLWYATQLPALDEQSVPGKDIIEALRKMEDQLDKALEP
jgi:hypothetical protein